MCSSVSAVVAAFSVVFAPSCVLSINASKAFFDFGVALFPVTLRAIVFASVTICSVTSELFREFIILVISLLNGSNKISRASTAEE